MTVKKKERNKSNQKAEADNNITEMLPVDTIVCAKGKQRSHHISQPAKAEALFKILPNFVLDLFSGPEGRTSLPLALFYFALLLASASAAAALEKQHSCGLFFGQFSELKLYFSPVKLRSTCFDLHILHIFCYLFAICKMQEKFA